VDDGGRGVVHSEEPSQEFQQTGGPLHGVQLWVNLPKTDKMIRPHYQEIPAARISLARTRDGKVVVRILAVESLDARAVIETRTPIFYLDFTLKPGGKVRSGCGSRFQRIRLRHSGAVLLGSSTARVERGNMFLLRETATKSGWKAPPEKRVLSPRVPHRWPGR